MRISISIGLFYILFACSNSSEKEVRCPIWEMITLKEQPTTFKLEVDTLKVIQQIDSILNQVTNWKIDTSFYAKANPLQLEVFKNGNYSFISFEHQNKRDQGFLLNKNELMYTFFENGTEPSDETYYAQGVAIAFRIEDYELELINQWDCERFIKADYWNFKKNGIRKLDYISRIIEL